VLNRRGGGCEEAVGNPAGQLQTDEQSHRRQNYPVGVMWAGDRIEAIYIRVDEDGEHGDYNRDDNHQPDHPQHKRSVLVSRCSAVNRDFHTRYALLFPPRPVHVLQTRHFHGSAAICGSVLHPSMWIPWHWRDSAEAA
jgi:hypothetical protein